MPHKLTGALQQVRRTRQPSTATEPDIHVRSEHVDVSEGRISQTCHRTAVMQKLPHFVAASPHHVKPLMRDGSPIPPLLFHPRIDGRIALDSAVESQELRFHRNSTFCIQP